MNRAPFIREIVRPYQNILLKQVTDISATIDVEFIDKLRTARGELLSQCLGRLGQHQQI